MPEPESICVYAGSAAGVRSSYAAAAAELGRSLGERGIRVMFGGGKVGLMGVLADAALAAGGEVTGVIPRSLLEREVGHRTLTELLVVDSMHERKLAMAERADAFVALPGGIGTVEELVEAMTWTQLGVHAKPCAVLDVDGYWEPFTAFLDHARTEGFMRDEHRSVLLRASDPTGLLEALAAWRPPAVQRWIGREGT